MTQSKLSLLAFFDKHLVTSRKNKSCKDLTKNRYLSDFVTNNYSFLKRELCGPFQRMEFKCLKHAELFQGDSLVLTKKSIGVASTLLIELTMESLSSFEPTNPGLVIDKGLIISLPLHSNKAMHKRSNILTEYDKEDISASYKNI